MWLAPLLSSSAAAFGRLLSVSLLPTGMLTMLTWLALRADAFNPETHGLRPGDLFTDFRLDTGTVLLGLLAVVVLAVLLQPFQILAVRLLEGYWTPSGVVGMVVRARRRRHVLLFRRYLSDRDADDKALELEELDPAVMDGLPLEEQVRRRREWKDRERRAERARARLSWYPHTEPQILPTLLGNVLRSSERRAGERYRLSTVDAMPRLHPHLSDRLATAYNSALDTLDAAVMLVLASAIGCVVSTVAFIDDPAVYWIPGGLLITSLLAYRGAITTAVNYGVLLDAAFDAHRFDLIRALRLPLPADTHEEDAQNRQLSEFWRAGSVEEARDSWRGVRYRHHEEPDSAPLDNEKAHPPGYL